MTVQELYNNLESMVAQGKGNLKVRILTDNPSIGKKQSTGIMFVSEGIDWESGEFNIVAEEKLMKMPYSHPLPTMVRKDGKLVELNNLNNPKNPE